MQQVPIGIDLGTTYSCIAHLDRQGEPHSLPNPEGELATPSVVFFDGKEVIVGTEALRNAVIHPERVVQNSKRFMGDPRKAWQIDGKTYRPADIGALVLRHLLDGAEQHVGPIEHAVITVPAQFSDIQRQQTVEAGLAAGLKKVDIINEPVAAALCYVLGEGLWFAELAEDQTVMVYDLGGGTFDLSLVKYNKNEVRVSASGGDLELGGIDWNRRMETFACEQFIKEVPQDPRLDKESMQALAIEVEQTKRSLSVRSRASLTLQHAGRRKVFGIDQQQFELLTHDLVERTERITQSLLKKNKLGWAHVDAVLVTGGASRMPMIRQMLQRISGTTLNQTLSPDQSIAHGAAYYAGMLFSGSQFARRSFLSKEASARLSQFRQQSVNARALGILVRNKETGEHVPHYLIPANTPLPCAFRQSFGTVNDGQRRVHLHIIESGTSEDHPVVKLGACVVDDLPPGLPAETPIEVTIRYDEQARVHVSAVETRSGRSARTTIVREENLALEPAAPDDAVMIPSEEQTPAKPERRQEPAAKGTSSNVRPQIGQSTFQPTSRSAASARPAVGKKPSLPPADKPRKVVRPVPEIEKADRPIPLCDRCGEPLDHKGRCPECSTRKRSAAGARKKKRVVRASTAGRRAASRRSQVAPPQDDVEILDLGTETARKTAKQSHKREGEEDFWELVE